MTVDDFKVLELEPLPTDADRKAATRVYETARGKRNRVSLGHPVVRRLEQPTADGLLTDADLASFRSADHDFWSVELALTLLPDEGCRFSSADFSIKLRPIRDGLPIVRRLYPERETSRKTIRVERSLGTTAGVNDKVTQVLDLGASISRKRTDEWEGAAVHLASFGAGTPDAGWRFTVTDGVDIPLSTIGLRMLCILPQGEAATARAKIVAGIEISNAVDRWITVAFRSKSGGLETSFEIG